MVTEERLERRRSIVSVARAATEHARRIGDALDQGDPGHAMMYNVYDKTIVDGMVHALTNVPAHEVGSPDGVIALLALRDQFAFLGVQMEQYLAGPWKHEEIKRAIESCGDDQKAQSATIQSAEKVLEGNVRTRLKQIQRYHDDLVTAWRAHSCENAESLDAVGTSAVASKRFRDIWFPGLVFFLSGVTVTKYFDWRAGRETQMELRFLRTLAIADEGRGALKLVRDSHGNITGGRIIDLHGAPAHSESSASGTLAVRKATPPARQPAAPGSRP